MSKKSVKLRNITITNAETGKVEKDLNGIDCAAIVVSNYNTSTTQTLLFSECSLPTILAVVSAAKDVGKKFKVGGTSADDFLGPFNALNLGNDDKADEDDEDDEPDSPSDDELDRLLAELKEKISNRSLDRLRRITDAL